MRKAVYVFYLIFFFIISSGSQLFAEEWFKVKSVIDGDTIILSDGRCIRYIGINAPEIEHETQKAEPYGYTAKCFNESLVLSKKVRLEFDKEKLDRYDRCLAYVFLQDGSLANCKIISFGYAYCLPLGPNVKYDSLFLQAQREAMSSRKGLWSHWTEKEEGCIGNCKSKRFHLISCMYGKKTEKRNRIFFLRKWEAFWAGFAPCKKCLAAHSLFEEQQGDSRH
jgi:micrococcal nuclease